MRSVNISDIAIITIKTVDYHCIMYNSKSEAINLLKDSVLEDGGYIYKDTVLSFSLFKTIFCCFFLLFCFAI